MSLLGQRLKDPNDDPVLKGLRDALGFNQAPLQQVEDPGIVIPCYGQIHIVRDRYGFLMLTGIVLYWIYGVWSFHFILVQPHYIDGYVSDWFIIYYHIVAALCLISLLRASTLHPGKVPHVTESFAKAHNWDLCMTCGRWRPERAHHCRRCGHCVVRMDHHCPCYVILKSYGQRSFAYHGPTTWNFLPLALRHQQECDCFKINNCVGESNHFVFSLLLFYAFWLSFNTFIVLMAHFWYWPKCDKCDHESLTIKYNIWFSYLCFIMSSAMALFMFMQFWTHHFNLLLNRTTIDNMKLSSIEDIQYDSIQIRRAYHAYSEHCGTRRFLLWPWPCRTRKSQLSDFLYA